MLLLLLTTEYASSAAVGNWLTSQKVRITAGSMAITCLWSLELLPPSCTEH